MNRTSLAWAALALVPAAVCAAPAWAATSTSIVVTSQGETLPRSSIQLFNADTGAEVQMEEKDDDRVAALFLLDRGRYRVTVGGRTVREISVSGSGAQSFTVEAPQATAPQGMTREDEARASDHMTGFDAEHHAMVLALRALYGDRRADTQAGIGFQRPSGGDETFAGRNADSIRMQGGAIGLSFPVGESWRAYVELSHAEGDETDRGDIPAGGGTDVGMPYSTFSPGGSTGVNLGPQGSLWSTSTEAQTTGLRLQAGPSSSEPVSWFLFAELQRDETDFDGAITIDAFGETFSQTRDQQVSEDRIGAGVGAAFNSGGRGRFQIGAWGEVGLYHRNAEARLIEHNLCPLCGPPDQDFFINIAAEDSGATWGASAGLEIGVPLGDRAALLFGAGASYVDETATMFNISSGDQVLDGQTSGLTLTERMMVNGEISFILRF